MESILDTPSHRSGYHAQTELRLLLQSSNFSTFQRFELGKKPLLLLSGRNDDCRQGRQKEVSNNNSHFFSDTLWPQRGHFGGMMSK
jgi:hypothetical protein